MTENAKTRQLMPAKIPALRESEAGVKIEKPYEIMRKVRGHIKDTLFFYLA